VICIFQRPLSSNYREHLKNPGHSLPAEALAKAGVRIQYIPQFIYGLVDWLNGILNDRYHQIIVNTLRTRVILCPPKPWRRRGFDTWMFSLFRGTLFDSRSISFEFIGSPFKNTITILLQALIIDTTTLFLAQPFIDKVISIGRNRVAVLGMTSSDVLNEGFCIHNADRPRNTDVYCQKFAV
jgi:hypothetical protein